MTLKPEDLFYRSRFVTSLLIGQEDNICNFYFYIYTVANVNDVTLCMVK